MADGSSGSPLSAVRRDTLALRLTLGFLGVALAAVALLAGLTAIFAANDVANLVNSQRTELTNAVAAAAGAAWDKNFTWRHADLNPALEFASRTGADAQIRDLDGNIVGSSRGFADQMGRPTFTAPVIVSRGTPEGRAIVRFGSSGLNSADNALVVALLRALGTAAGIVALVALVTALGISRRLARPVAHIIAVTRAMGSGRRDARVGSISAPSELRELATAFDQMADKLDRNEQLRRDLVADVAHELRTPVAVLQAGHEALLDGVAEPTPDELVSLRDEVLRLARMVGDLQTLSAADAAALHLVRRRRDLAAIAAAAADSLAPRFEAAGTVLERRLAPVEVLADERWLHQLITNLLTNALKYSPTESHVIIDVRPDGQDAVLRVIDAGMGIPAADLPHIFDRFWRGKQALDTSGSGIGLAIAFELATAHGGTLNAVSDPGEGTQMTLTLPRALAWRPLRQAQSAALRRATACELRSRRAKASRRRRCLAASELRLAALARIAASVAIAFSILVATSAGRAGPR